MNRTPKNYLSSNGFLLRRHPRVSTNAFPLPADEFLVPLFIGPLPHARRAYILCKLPLRRLPLGISITTSTSTSTTTSTTTSTETKPGRFSDGITFTVFNFLILYFLIAHNALFLPPKFCSNYCWKCWEVSIFPRAFLNNSLCQIGGPNRAHHGQVENRECSCYQTSDNSCLRPGYLLVSFTPNVP